MSRFPIVVMLAAAVAVSAGCSSRNEAPPAASADATAPAAATPPAAPQPANVKEFTIGELAAVALRDGMLEFPNDNQVFGIGRTPQEVSALLTPAGLPTDKLQLGLHPLLVKTTDRILLFDTGAGSNFGPGAGKLPDSLAESGIDAQSVTDIFISHVHGDHVGGIVDAQGAPAFPNARIHISKPEWKFLRGLGAEKAKSIGVQNYDALVAAMKPKVEDFAPNAELLPGVVQAVEIKGHTPGHSGYRITSGQDSLLYIGDAMHHYILSVQKPDWPMGFDSDRTTGANSRAALVADLAQSGQRVYAVHFPFPGLGRIEKQGKGYVWVAE
jgi:glyoxylase-like metal-dependent hydrolase (beta-lactamase superfamily II)